MRNILTFHLSAVLLFLAWPFCASAKEINAEALLKQGNAAYAKNDYKTAANVYQQVLDAGYESAAVYYNLGNANYKLSEIPEAIFNYEKALKLNPGDADVQLNLELANLRITDRIAEVPVFFLSKWWQGLVYFFSLGTLSIFTVVCFLVGFALIIVYLFLIDVGPKKLSFYSGITCLGLGLIFMMMAAMQSHYLNSTEQGIVFAGSVDVKSGPDVKQKTLFVVHEGTKVSIREQEGAWIKVVLANGNGGWIKFSGIKKL